MNDDLSYDRDATYDRDRDLGERGAEHQGKGTMDKVSGKVQEGWGKLTHDKSDEIEGKMKQGKGSMEQGLGRAEDELDSNLP